MPVYVYQCEACRYRFEELQSMKDEPLRICPKCQGPVHRLISHVGVVFKGSGFYVTDHRHDTGNGRKPKIDKKGEKVEAETNTAIKEEKKEAADISTKTDRLD